MTVTRTTAGSLGLAIAVAMCEVSRVFREFYRTGGFSQTAQVVGALLEKALSSLGNTGLKILGGTDVGNHYHLSSGRLPVYSYGQVHYVPVAYCEDKLGLMSCGDAFTVPEWNYNGRVAVIQSMLLDPAASILASHVLHQNFPRRREYCIPNADVLQILDVASGQTSRFETTELGPRARYMVHRMCSALSIESITTRTRAKTHKKAAHDGKRPQSVVVRCPRK